MAGRHGKVVYIFLTLHDVQMLNVCFFNTAIYMYLEFERHIKYSSHFPNTYFEEIRIMSIYFMVGAIIVFLSFFLFLIIFFKSVHLRTYSLIPEKEEGREKNIDAWGLNSQPRWVPQPEIEPSTL